MRTNNKLTNIIATTTNSSVYNKARWDYLDAGCSLVCSMCRPHRGCNRTRNVDNSWKSHRRTQYRGVDYAAS